MNSRAIFRLWAACSLLAAATADAQVVRVRGMGGITLPLHDPDHGLNPYDQAGNPAWLQEDETGDWLRIIPSAGDEWGGLKRRYDPARIVRFGTAFDGRRDLFEKGAFRGIASYDVEQRRDVYRSLKRHPYAGEAFFITDTTVGNFTYNGPTVQFLYSYELFAGLDVGASVRYQIQDGLKDTYSRTKALYRNLQTSVGATLKLWEGWVAGATIEPWDTQESMEAKSEESYEVELFSFRGDTYATRQRGSSIDHKVRKKGIEAGGHLFGRPCEGMELGLLGSLGSGETRILIPKGLEKEAQEGYTPSRHWEVRAQARVDANEEVTLGARVGYRRERNWSEHSALGLLLWDWKAEEFSAGLGAAWHLSPHVLAALEAEYGRTSVDSFKFIDNRSVSAAPSRFLLRAGVEVEATPGLMLRGGGHYRSAAIDLENGWPDVAGYGVTAGAGIRIADQIQLECFAEYRSQSPEGMPELRRGGLAGGLMLTLTSP